MTLLRSFKMKLQNRKLLSFAMTMIFFSLFLFKLTAKYSIQNVKSSRKWKCDTWSRPASTSTYRNKKFWEYMRKWPIDKPRAAIYYLIGRKDRDDWTLQNALRLLDKNFNDKFHYPVLIFHEADARTRLGQIREWTTSTIFFVEVNFTIPSWVNVDWAHQKYVCRASNIGYKHMCRFHAKLVYHHAAVQEFEYLLRQDDDSEIRSPINYDIFKFMKSNSYVYGYHSIMVDNPYCMYKLPTATREYMHRNNISPTFFHEWYYPEAFFNNFEISQTCFWLSKEYQNYINYLDSTGNIYYIRWGDAPMKTYGLSLFLPWSQIYQFQDIDYYHPPHHSKPGLLMKWTQYIFGI